MAEPPETPARPRPKRARRRARARPEAGPSLVEPALRRLRILEQVRAMRALRAYARSCGPRFLERTRAERFQRGTLFIRVESSAWANELVFVREQLLEQLRRVPGGEAVRELRFSVGPLGELPAWDEAPAKAPPERPPQPVDPRVAAALTQVQDDDLRDALGALYVRACKAGRR